MLSRYAHLSPTHRWKAVEGLAQVGTVTEPVTEEWAGNGETQKLLKDVVSHFGPQTELRSLREVRYFALLPSVPAAGHIQSLQSDCRRHPG